MKTSRNIFLGLIAFSLTFGLTIFSFQQSYAAHGIAPILPRLIPGPFGGKIHEKRSCNCIGTGPFFIPFPYGKYLEVGPPLGGNAFIVLDSIGSILIDVIPVLPDVTTKVYEHGKLEEGQFVLGVSQIPPLPCFTIKIALFVPVCKSNGIGWYVNKIGTSDLRSLR